MRRIVLDTETTGLEPELGHRVIEVAALELQGRQQTGRHFHRYLHPDRDIDPEAQKVHGLTLEFLADKPRFPEVCDELLEFVEGAEVLIHNAPFDVAFLNAELKRAGRPGIDTVCRILDTLAMARELHPGKRNSLNALCERYAVDNSRRTLHGALMDTQLLAEVWLAFTRGQETLDIAPVAAAPVLAPGEVASSAPVLVLRATAEEAALHAAMCERIDQESKGACLWKALGPKGVAA